MHVWCCWHPSVHASCRHVKMSFKSINKLKQDWYLSVRVKIAANLIPCFIVFTPFFTIQRWRRFFSLPERCGIRTKDLGQVDPGRVCAPWDSHWFWQDGCHGACLKNHWCKWGIWLNYSLLINHTLPTNSNRCHKWMVQQPAVIPC